MSYDQRTQSQYEYIDLIVAFEGLITNQRLREKFGVSNVQSSRIIAAYREAFPQNLEFIKGEGRGRYKPSVRFKPGASSLSIDRYFQISAKSNVQVAVEDTRQDFTKVEPKTFRMVHAAISNQNALKINYRSMNNPKGLERIIHPLAFVFAGRRWHVRAYDEASSEHRDFNLARIGSIQLNKKNIAAPVDSDWDELVELQLRPHPNLTQDQESLIRDELFDGAAGRNIKTRKALINYVLRELEVAHDLVNQKPPEYQIYLYKVENLKKPQEHP